MSYEKKTHIVNIICSETVRYSFVSHLSGALRRQGISVSVFADTDESELETHFFPDDQNQGARVSVVVFTETCASSVPWFAKHLERHKSNGCVIVPVFYGVDPSVVNLEFLGTLPIDDNITAHQSSDSDLVEEIVRDVYGKLYPTERIGIYSRLLEIENLLCEQPWDIRRLGIWGMPGIGKTTLAKALFERIHCDYNASCFIENFDEGLSEGKPQRLLEEQIFKVVIEKFGVSSSYITRLSLLKDKLCDSRILLVLDDVRNPLVADSFLGRLDWFGPGSLIIITSRYKQVFALCQVNEIYKIPGLNEQEALQLFSQTVFEKDVPEQDDLELSMEVIDYANGNPLALRVYGQELEEATFLELKQCPPQKIQDGVRSVYSALGDNEKHIFLDIACFFKGENVDYVAELLKGCGYFPRVGMDILVEKCLLSISENILQMSDLIQDIFREIVIVDRIQMNKCTTMWQPSSIRYLLEDDELKGDNQLKETPKCVMVAEDIRGICLDVSNMIFDVKPDAFKTMGSLMFLKIYSSHSENIHGLEFPKGLNSLPSNLRLLHWEKYPFKSLPQGFDLLELVELSMPYSQLRKLRARTKNLKMLKRIRLCHSGQLVKFSIHGHAKNIELLDLQGCTRLKSFPAMTKLQHLRVLNLSGCSNIKIVPGLPPNIEELYLQGTSIEEMPKSIVAGCSRPNSKELMNHMKNFPGFEHIDLESVTNMIKVSSYNQGFGKLVRLNMKDCLHLRSLLDMFNLESLQVLDLSGCSSLEEIKGFPRNMKELYLGGTRIRELPEFPESLEFLNAHDCYHLKSVHLDFKQLPRHYTFSNCFSLSLETTAEFLEKGLTRVIGLTKEENQEYIKAPRFNVCFAADVCPSTNSHMRAGSFVTVERTPITQKALLGFAMSVLVSFRNDFHNAVGLGIKCICTWGTKKGHFGSIVRVFKCWAPTEAPRVGKNHVFVFYDSEMQPGAGETNDSSIADGEIKFEFDTVSGENKLLGAACMVIKCGVQVITSPTGDKLVSGITKESEARSIIEEDTSLFPRKPEAKSTSVIEEDTPVFPREPEVQSRGVIKEETLPFPSEPEEMSANVIVIKEDTPLFQREEDVQSISVIEEETHPFPSLPEEMSTSDIVEDDHFLRLLEATSISFIEKDPSLFRPRPLTGILVDDEESIPSPREPEEKSTSVVEDHTPLSSSEPHMRSSMRSKVRSKGIAFWKWIACFTHVTPVPDKNFPRRSTRVLGESKEKGKIMEVEDMEQIKHSKTDVKEDVNPPHRISNVCNSAIEDGKSVNANASDAAWHLQRHLQCLCCLHCHKPIAVNEIPDLKGTYHKHCVKKHHRICYVCKNMIARHEGGIKYNAHPFWKEKYCPSHESDGTPKCCSCERLEPHGTEYVLLPDGRWLCLECIGTAIMDTDECQPLHFQIREFFEGLYMKFEKEFPVLLVERQALNIAEKEEKIDYHHGVVTRSLCLSEEQIVTSVSRGPRMGPRRQLRDIVTETRKVSWGGVTAILVLYGLPRLLTGYILVHEMMHAWLKLNGHKNISLELKEGLCQQFALMWLESQQVVTDDSSASSSTYPSASTSTKGYLSDFEKKLLEFCKYQIETNDSPVYSVGLKKVRKMMVSNNYSVMGTLRDIIIASKTHSEF